MLVASPEGSLQRGGSSSEGGVVSGVYHIHMDGRRVLVGGGAIPSKTSDKQINKQTMGRYVSQACENFPMFSFECACGFLIRGSF